MEKVSAELFCFTYGAMVSQLLRQHKDAAEVKTLVTMMLIAILLRCPSFEHSGTLRVVCKTLVQVSSHLEKMGHSIGKPRMRSWRAFADAVAAGTRLIDEMLAKTSMGSCADFKVSGGDAACARWIDVLGQETVQVIARVGFKMFLNINANVTAMNAEGTECK
jgi:hypothetical protein